MPSEWIVPLPDGLSAKQAMTIGTAGYTAARCVIALEAAGLTPDAGPVLVTGASGGVGSTAVDILAARGYEVVASTGKDQDVPARAGRRRGDLARGRGGRRVAAAGEVALGGRRRLRRRRGARGRDPRAASTAAPWRRAATPAASKLPTTVLPFILRGVSLLGVDSVQTPIKERTETWKRLATDLRPPHLEDALAHEIDLDGLEDVLTRILRGRDAPAGRSSGSLRSDDLGGAALEARDELVEAQLLEPLADGLELGGAELDERRGPRGRGPASRAAPPHRNPVGR